MKWLTNTKYPFTINDVFVLSNESRLEAFEKHTNYLKDKIISNPKATDTYTVKELKAMGMKGVYIRE